MSTQTLLNSLFQYKASVDDELLDALNALGAEVRSDDFRSALRVLNHAHLVDRIFAANLRRLDHTYTAGWSSEAPPLAQLSSAIRKTDRWYIDYTSRITLPEMEEVVDFTFTDGGRGTDPARRQ
ncbi:hypothetical protein HB775_07320 [Rhizobium leguminosarum bv. trifolii]|nr:hypothetical protein HB775_07320 [Rhizobium leguminosarum bv. trifolii]